MIEKSKMSLADGTLVRHKVQGYEGQIEGTTEIKGCFTRGGVALAAAAAKEQFQYRVVVVGESLRRIAPVDDLEIVEETRDILCIKCNRSFRTRPGLLDKPGGRCECGGFICPSCWGCQSVEADPEKRPAAACAKERKRLARKHTMAAKAKTTAVKRA